ncbi:MAG: ExeM/NucH family extracellular endonuclease [Pseudomonadota bacterium]
MRRPLPSSLSLLCFGGLFVAAAASAQDAPIAIGKVQGTGERSPLVGREVVVEGVVTITPGNGLEGWFLQDAGDGDAATSDGLFVAAGDTPAPGQRVRIRGTVVELNAGNGTRTALQPTRVTPLGKGKVRAVAIAAAPPDWERYENMRVLITASLTVAGTHRADKYAELFVNFGERLRTPSDIVAPGEAARALAADNARRTLRLDDGSDMEQPASIWYLPKTGLPRTGTRLSKAEGVLDQRGGSYRLQLTAKPAFRRMTPPAAPKVGGDVRIASFNLENFFNGDGQGGGFPTSRGARNPAELDTQRARLVTTIRALNPDIAALMEVENDGFGPESAIATLIDALNAGGGDWRAIVTDADQGGDQIRVGLIYRASRVSPVGTAATLTDDLFGTRNRPPLAQTFRAGVGASLGPAFTVVANHFKSKGCGNASGADADQKDGQSCWNATRTESARRLDAWLRTDPTRSGNDMAMIVGDLNAYSMEDPITTLTAAGWRDAFAGQRGPVPYSYVYDGLTGRLDHALLSPALAARVVGAAEWHSNADEPDSRGYQSRPGDRAPWRSSDHDPLVVGFKLRKP